MSEILDGLDDVGDLGFDVEPHREALRVFIQRSFSPESIRAGLKARDLVFARRPSGKFYVGVTDAPSCQEEAEKRRGCVAFELLHHTENGANAQQVSDELNGYFRRHFPGRCVDQTAGTSIPENAGYVFIALFGPEN